MRSTRTTHTITIDRALCRKDYACVNVCPRRLIGEGADGFPEATRSMDANCIECGHCLAVCPHGALSLNGVAPEECETVGQHKPLDLEAVDFLVRGRRSVREFKGEPIAPEILDWVLDASRWAPSAGNGQPVHLTVVDGRAKTRRLAELVVDWMRGTGSDYVKDVIAAWDEGKDRVLHDAPHLVIAHAPDGGLNPATDCVIAITTIELAAHMLGAGACWAGFFTRAAATHAPLLEALALPERHKVRAALMLGMPRYRYHRLPPRREPRVRRL